MPPRAGDDCGNRDADFACHAGATKPAPRRVTGDPEFRPVPRRGDWRSAPRPAAPHYALDRSRAFVRRQLNELPFSTEALYWLVAHLVNANHARPADDELPRYRADWFDRYERRALAGEATGTPYAGHPPANEHPDYVAGWRRSAVHVATWEGWRDGLLGIADDLGVGHELTADLTGYVAGALLARFVLMFGGVL